ncbi:hypothetical protein C5C71_12900 [Rathayibacter sp. AY1C1]|uniref:PqqD family protein n=1 Tax=Rathayibacter sp. AY1C1 TaxID=2080534 RepID=UPI000CE7EC7D|nr:PqqD family protein [Rathayibacter sp. AY1C1]PPH08409.1 hypothetical protein C5C71_12900 [Rathayibacter sp. AY1C1]
MTRRLIRAPFGLGVRFTFDDTVPDRFVAEVEESWNDVDDDADRPGSEYRVSLTEPVGEPGVIAQPTEDALAEHIGAALTLAAADACEGRLLSVHAAAVALPDGRVVAFAGRPGAGKSTLVSLAARRYGYVTDETLAVRRDGRVLPFRKPVALLDGGDWKRHRSPAAMGLQPLPDAPLRLAALLLIARDPSGPAEPRLEPIAFDEALSVLLPELSHFARLPAALHHLAGLLDSVGGAQVLRYREAETVLPLLERIGEPSPVVADAPEADAAAPGPGLLARAAGVEWVERDGVVSCLLDERVETLNGIGPVLWRALGTPATVDALTGAVVAEHGAPPAGDPRAHVEAVLDAMVEHGLVVRGA